MIPLSLAQRVQDRVVDHELRRRLGPGAPTTVQLPPELPPAALLAARAFPVGVLERRLRFIRAVGWWPEPPFVFSDELGPRLPLEASLEDEIATLWGASQVQVTDPALSVLSAALRLPLSGRSAAPAGDLDELDAFFDRMADQIDPGWRDHAGPATAIPPAWSRLEAATTHADWWFGRRRAGRFWRILHGVVTALGNQKRRRWR